MTPVELRGDRQARGAEEKNYCFQKPASAAPTSPPTHTHAHTHTSARPLRPRSWTNFAAVGKGLRQAPEKFSRFFDKARPRNPRAPGRVATTTKSRSLRRVEHPTSLLQRLLFPSLEYAKRAASAARMCVYGVQSGHRGRGRRQRKVCARASAAAVILHEDEIA